MKLSIVFGFSIYFIPIWQCRHSWSICIFSDLLCAPLLFICVLFSFVYFKEKNFVSVIGVGTLEGKMLHLELKLPTSTLI